MPEAAVNKDSELMTRQDDIRLSREIGTMNAKPIPKRMQERPDFDLRSSVPAPDRGHIAAALLATVNVCH